MLVGALVWPFCPLKCVRGTDGPVRGTDVECSEAQPQDCHKFGPISRYQSLISADQSLVAADWSLLVAN